MTSNSDAIVLSRGGGPAPVSMPAFHVPQMTTGMPGIQHQQPPNMSAPSNLLGVGVSSIMNIHSKHSNATDPWPNVPATIVRTAAHDAQCAFVRGVAVHVVNEEGLPRRVSTRRLRGRANVDAIITQVDLNRMLFKYRDNPEYQNADQILHRFGVPCGFIDSVSPATQVSEQVIYFNNGEEQTAAYTPFGKARMMYNVWGTAYYDLDEVTVCDRPNLHLWFCLVRKRATNQSFLGAGQNPMVRDPNGTVTLQPSSSVHTMNMAPRYEVVPERVLDYREADPLLGQDLAALEDTEATFERKRFAKKRTYGQQTGRLLKRQHTVQQSLVHWAWVPVCTYTREGPPERIYAPFGADWVGACVYVGQSGKIDGVGTAPHTQNLVFPQGTSWIANLGAMQQMEIVMTGTRAM